MGRRFSKKGQFWGEILENLKYVRNDLRMVQGYSEHVKIEKIGDIGALLYEFFRWKPG